MRRDADAAGETFEKSDASSDLRRLLSIEEAEMRRHLSAPVGRKSKKRNRSPDPDREMLRILKRLSP